MADFSELKKLDEKALQAKLGEARKALFDLRMEKSTSGAANMKDYISNKRGVAQILTLLNQRKSEKK